MARIDDQEQCGTCKGTGRVTTGRWQQWQDWKAAKAVGDKLADDRYLRAFPCGFDETDGCPLRKRDDGTLERVPQFTPCTDCDGKGMRFTGLTRVQIQGVIRRHDKNLSGLMKLVAELKAQVEYLQVQLGERALHTNERPNP